MDEAYGLNSINDIFKEAYAPVVNSIYDGTHSSAYIDGKLTHKASDLFKKDFIDQLLNGEKQAVINAFKDNDVYDWKPKAPTRLFHGVDDDWVPFEQSQITYDAMIANGSQNLQLVECTVADNKPTNHANCFFPYLLASYQFFLQYASDL